MALFPHLWHILSLAGHCCILWIGDLPHLPHTFSLIGSVPWLEACLCLHGRFPENWRFVCGSFCYPVCKASTDAAGVLVGWFRNVLYCFFTASLWRTAVSNIRFDSS